MSKQIKVRGYLRVEVLVPNEMTVDLDELDEWLMEDGSPGWDGGSDDVLEFIKAGDPADWQGSWPKADPDLHSVEGAELVEVEVLGTVEP